jgi:endonuclease G
MKRLFALAAICLPVLFWTGCSEDSNVPINPVVTDTTSLPVSSPLTETFESGNKQDYASSSIQLTTGKWNFTDAVIGNTADDKKNGSRSVRIARDGKISMNFDIINGIYQVVVSHAVYAADGPGTWQLWASFNQQIGNTVTTSSSTLVKDTFLVNSPGKVRFSIRKTSGSGSQINIDDFRVLLSSNPVQPGTADNDNMLMGNPSNATPSVLTPNNFFMNKGYYVLCYNKDEGKTSWASWHLYNNDLGSAPRQNDYRPDTELPAIWYRADNASYNGSGFDRGHVCPSADRTSTVAANSSTFLMTNIIPQAPFLNQNAWARMEDSCRLLLNSGKELYIITGSFGSGGTGNFGFASSINSANLIVPAFIWKVVVVLPNGNNDLSRIDNNTRVISVLAPNQNSVTTNWKDYRVSVDSIESRTGYDLLSNLPVNIQQVLEARVDGL